MIEFFSESVPVLRAVANPYRVLFVCMGNICRSPSAEAAARKQVRQAGLFARVHLDSAGLGGWHADELPDPRARQVARRRGVELVHRARRINNHDFERFDLILAMDKEVQTALLSMCPLPEHRDKCALFRSFDPSAAPGAEVPDPYMGGLEEFESMFDLCDAAATGLVAHLARTL